MYAHSNVYVCMQVLITMHLVRTFTGSFYQHAGMAYT